MRRLWWALLVVAGVTPRPVAGAGSEPGPFVRGLWLVQRYGRAGSVDPANDARVKGALAKALGKEGVLTAPQASALFDPAVFAKLAGSDGRLEPSEVREALEAAMPESRRRLLPAVLAYADELSTSFDRVDEPHREAGARLVEWVVANNRAGRPLHVTVICTGNSRRSILGATMGNVAAAYHGFPEIRFHSGGTAPTACNPRTVAALKAVGVELTPTGAEAPRGEPKTANPVYRVRWGDGGLETTEFSKHYLDPANPHEGFAALLVCGEADTACPVVKGASARIAMPYLDPKIFDDSPYEAEKYAERRDDLGRLMLSVFAEARRRLDPNPPAR